MKNVSPVQTALRYGLILGLILILITVVLYIMGLLTNPNISLLSGILFLLSYTIVIVMAIRSHKNDIQNGYITLGKGFVVGLLTSFFASILMICFYYVLYAFIDPDLIEEQLKMTEEMMENFGFLSDDDIEATMDDARAKSTPFRYSLNQLSMVCCGSIISLIAALTLKREPLDDNQII